MKKAFVKAFAIAAEIASKYGLTLLEDDFDYNYSNFTWVITPYDSDSGFECQDGLWWGVNIDSWTVRFMDGDWDMFDEIAKALDGIEPEDE